jgi:hypothetical protein
VTFQEAQEEFAVRYYLWAGEETRKEVEQGFPLLRRMDTGMCRRYLRRMAQLSTEAQHAFAALLVKRFHPLALKLLGDTLSSEEIAEITRYADVTAVEFDPLEEAFFQRQSEGDPSTKLNRRRFKKVVKEYLIPVLGREDKWGGGGTWRYKTPIENLCVETYLDTGGTHHQLCYSHAIIFSGYQTLIEQTSVLSWLGLSGQTSWRQLDDSKAEATARLLAELCDHFFKAIPNLLKRISP